MAPWVLLFIHPKVRPISFQSQPRLSPPARGPGQRPRPGGDPEARRGDRDRGRAGAGGHSQGSIQPGRHRQDKDTRTQAGQGQEGRDGEAGRAGTGSGEAEGEIGSLSLHFGPSTVSGSGCASGGAETPLCPQAGGMPASPGHRGHRSTPCAHPALLSPAAKG